MMPRNVLKIWEVSIKYQGHKWTCGFCGEELDNWERRGRHIARHFREGMTMKGWNDGLEKRPDEDANIKAVQDGSQDKEAP